MMLSNTYDSVRRILSNFIFDRFLTYSTVKVVQVPNTFVALVYRILQLIIIAYIAVYIVWYKKGYQQSQEPRGTSVIKVKGIAKVTGNGTSRYVSTSSQHLWDIAEYQIPPLENNAFFIATRQVVTYNQAEGTCLSAIEDKLFCNNATALTDCPKDQPTPNTFGYFTGLCLPTSRDALVSVCQINAWCPEELSNSTEYVVNSSDVESFTVYLKTMVTFTLFDVNIRNVRDDTNFTCRYDKYKNPRCPILRIGDILSSLKSNTNTAALLREGGIIEIRQDWTCNFDFNPKHCYPTLAFSVLQSGDDKQSPGINYRAAQKFHINNTDYRILSKIYGLRFVIAISGKGGQFDIVNLFFAIGSGIGFMVIAGIVCDAIFMYIHKSRDRYRRGKFDKCEISSKRISVDENSKTNMAYQTSADSFPYGSAF